MYVEPHYRHVWQYDLEQGLGKTSETYDAVVISHILEHIKNPDALMRDLVRVTEAQSYIICAIPNMLFISNRLKLLRGLVEYEPTGLMDHTHGHFY